MLPEEAISAVQRMFDARTVAIDPASILGNLLGEAQKFVDATKDLRAGRTDAETDEAAVQAGGSLLAVVRLGMALQAHEAHRTPKLTETLINLSSFRVGRDQHDDQFSEAEYELHAASQFVGCGHRVAFVDTKSPSRFDQRVEFMLGYKWPVECKRPRVRGRILENIKKATDKLNERAQPGIASVALESALPHSLPFRETFNVEEVRHAISEEFGRWWEAESKEVLKAIAGSFSRYLILNYTALTYTHDTGEIGLPSLRLGLTQTGEWIQTDVCSECVRRLAHEREIVTGQWVP
ncbi:MAG: hypothetical protein HY898_03935 [Deltaproteobacteria bacterium]|nr:hypothetical protein [Deltaproteobacteria bacterium]